MGNLPRHPEPTYKSKRFIVDGIASRNVEIIFENTQRKGNCGDSANDGYGSKIGTCDSR